MPKSGPTEKTPPRPGILQRAFRFFELLGLRGLTLAAVYSKTSAQHAQSFLRLLSGVLHLHDYDPTPGPVLLSQHTGKNGASLPPWSILIPASPSRLTLGRLVSP